MRHDIGKLDAEAVAESDGLPSGLTLQRSRAWSPSTWPGRPPPELGQRYGLAQSSVIRLVRDADERLRHLRLSASETARLVALYEVGLSQKDIAVQLWRSPSAVWHCLRRLGRA